MRIRSQMTIVLFAVAAASFAQSPPPASDAPFPPSTPVRVVSDAPLSKSDPRVCLEFPTNQQVMACAEKFRSRRAVAKT